MSSRPHRRDRRVPLPGERAGLQPADYAMLHTLRTGDALDFTVGIVDGSGLMAGLVPFPDLLGARLDFTGAYAERGGVEYPCTAAAAIGPSEIRLTFAGLTAGAGAYYIPAFLAGSTNSQGARAASSFGAFAA